MILCSEEAASIEHWIWGTMHEYVPQQYLHFYRAACNADAV